MRLTHRHPKPGITFKPLDAIATAVQAHACIGKILLTPPWGAERVGSGGMARFVVCGQPLQLRYRRIARILYALPRNALRFRAVAVAYRFHQLLPVLYRLPPALRCGQADLGIAQRLQRQ